MLKHLVFLILFSTCFMFKSMSFDLASKKRLFLGQTGGEREISTSDTYAKLAMSFVLDSLNKISNDTILYNMVKLNKAYIKVVSGYLYRFEYDISRIACQKGASGTQICFVDSKKGSKNCSGKVWYQAWKPQNETYQLVENKCQ